MNVSGVNVAPVAPPQPAVTRALGMAEANADPQKDAREAAARRAGEQRKEIEKLPPLKPLTTTEMRVMLGALPPSHALGRDAINGQGRQFDAYL